MLHDYHEFVGYYIQNLSKLFTYRHNAMLERIGLTYSQFRILCTLWDGDGKTQNEILKLTLIRPATLSGILVTLEKKGYITRVRSTGDGRNKFVYLTEMGKDLEIASFGIIEALDTQVSSGLDEARKLELVSSLKDLLDYTGTLELPNMPKSASRIKP